MNFKNKKEETVTYENLKNLFSTGRDVRNELFGSYLSEGNVEPVELKKKVEEKIAHYTRLCNNLKVLKQEVSRLAADAEAEKIKESVAEMSFEQAEAIMEQLKKKLSEQQANVGSTL